MPSILRAAVAAVVGLAAVLVPFLAPVPQAVAATPPKVVIIVGPVAGTTASYRSDADAAATEALKYTSNVVRIYSPNATWDVVKPALQGASIVIYMGHGNGFPSPYSTTLQPDRQDGLGLNPTAGGDDSTTKYWGEKYIASDVRLAPNAVVLLGHLCYASGSSEPGKAEPTLTQAKQRVDNFAAGFLAAGARAVIAEAYGGAAAGYVGSLFTAHSTLGTIWANSFSSQGNAFSFASTRTPGMTVQMDPDRSSGKYYRAIVGDMSLPSDAAVTGSASSPGPTPDPSSPTPTPSPSPSPSPTPSPPVDDTPNVGFTSAGMSLSSISAPNVFSPNGDGVADTFPIHARLSTAATWQLTITDQGGGIFLSTGGLGDAIDVDWDGTSGGARLPDGVYTYRLSAANGLGGSLDRISTVRIDTTAPTFVPTGAAAGTSTFSPNGDGAGDTWTGSFKVSETVSVEGTVLAADGTVIRHVAGTSRAGIATVTWDGRSDGGAGVADGQYTITLRARDAAGNPGVPVAAAVAVYRGLSKVTASATLFYPQDGDAYAPSTSLGFVLVQPATVSWSIVDSRGRAVATRLASAPLGAGSVVWPWTGLDDAGRPVAPGTYTAVLTAGNGIVSITSRTVLTVAAFKITVSPTTSSRGQNVTVTAVTAEPLRAAPRLTISQPGLAARSVAMVKVATNTYRVTTRLSTGGSAGTLALKVSGTDAGGGINLATAAATLR